MLAFVLQFKDHETVTNLLCDKLRQVAIHTSLEHMYIHAHVFSHYSHIHTHGTIFDWIYIRTCSMINTPLHVY